MNSKRPLSIGCLIAALAASLAGCGGTKFPRTELISEVTLDGDPVGEAQVYLTLKSVNPRDKGNPATFTAAVVDGSFLFDQRNGPPPGEYEVVVMPVEPDAEEAMAELLARKGTLIRDRSTFLAAAGRKGPIRVELSGEDLNEMLIELTTR